MAFGATVAAELKAALRGSLERWRRDPVTFVYETFPTDPEGKPTEVDGPQADILRAYAQDERVGVRSCHGIGKTTTASWMTHHWLATRYPALVVTAAGTWNHLSDKLWPEIAVWHRVWLLRKQFQLLTMELRGWENPHGWRAKAASSDKPENVEGYHSPNLLLLTDEAKAMPDEVRSALKGAQTGKAEFQREVVLSTPPLVDAGWYADLFSRKGAGWRLLHFAASDSSRVSAEYVEEMARTYGVESAVYQSKVNGNIPTTGTNAVILPLWFERAQAKAPQPPPPGRQRGSVLTCDVAREGEDLTVCGLLKDFKWTIPLEEDTQRPAWRATNDLMEIVGLLRDLAVQTGAVRLILDDTGLGGGLTDRLLELQRKDPATSDEWFPKECFIIPKKFGAKAQVREDRFGKLKDEMWWKLRDVLRENRLALPTEEELAAYNLPRDSNLRSQLCSAIYEEDSSSRLRVIDKRPKEDKRERYKSLPTKSPDLAHSLMMGIREYLLLPEEEAPAVTPVQLETRRLHQALQQRRWQRGEAGMPAEPGFLE